MPARIRQITFDCGDPYLLSGFWKAVLGFVDDPDGAASPGDPEVLIVDPQARHPGLLFIAVPEPKSVKDRIHLDLQPHDARDVAVEAVLALGASVVADHRRPDGTGWVVVADPEGNELCIERSAAERGERPPRTVEDSDYPEGTATAGEPEMLTNVLDWYRAAVERKVADVDDRLAHTSPVRSGTTIAGLVKHLALVEDSWFTDRFAGGPEPEPWASAPWDEDPDWEFHTAIEEPLADVVGLYREACDRSRHVVVGRSLDDLAAGGRRPFTLRYATVHLIEETARHLGHVDILREYLDGTVGE
jgi:hypothetical protein